MKSVLNKPVKWLNKWLRTYENHIFELRIKINPVQAWIFFRPYFHYCLSSANYCEDQAHIFHPKARAVDLVPEGLDAPLKKNKLFICACLSFDDYSLFGNANHYYPDQKLKCGDHILYWHINIDTLNHLFSVGSQLPDFSFVSLKTELP